jgi:hypothetical protein
MSRDMSITSHPPARHPWPARLFFGLPVIGTIAREVIFGDKDNIWYALVIVLTGLILAVAQWGLAALVVFYLPFVAIAFVLIIVFAKPW